jgi:hypothetical protein
MRNVAIICAVVAATFQLAPASAKEFRTVVAGPCAFVGGVSYLFSGAPGIIDPPRESKRLIVGVTMPASVPANTDLCVKLSPNMPVGTRVELYFIGKEYPYNPPFAGTVVGIYLLDENNVYVNAIGFGTSPPTLSPRPGVFVRKLFPSATAPDANGSAWGSSP